MAAVIIFRKDVERLGKRVLKDVYNFLHDYYIVTDYNKMKEEQEKLDYRLLLKEVKINKKFKNYFDLDEESKKEMEEEIKKITEVDVNNGKYFIDDIYHFLVDIEILEELNDDVMFELESFLEIYRVFTYSHSTLKD